MYVTVCLLFFCCWLHNICLLYISNIAEFLLILSMSIIWEYNGSNSRVFNYIVVDFTGLRKTNEFQKCKKTFGKEEFTR